VANKLSPSGVLKVRHPARHEYRAGARNKWAIRGAARRWCRKLKSLVHELNDYRQEALESFNWIKKHGNPLGNIIGLQFAEKKDYVPLQAADILAYEGNKRLRDPSRQERRAWTALDPDKTRIFAAYYGRDNMADLISRLELIRDGRFDEIDLGSGWKRAAQAAGAGSWEGLRA